jgi:hypothetical protein
MAVSVVHPFSSPVADAGSATEVGPNEWNANHTVTLTGPALLGRSAAGDGAAAEIGVGRGLVLDGTGLGAGPAVVPYPATSDTIASAPRQSYFEEFLRGTPWEHLVENNASGSGGIQGPASGCGVYRVGTGTVATGRRHLHPNTFTLRAAAGRTFRTVWRVAMLNAPTSTEQSIHQVGFFNNLAGALGYGACFRWWYDTVALAVVFEAATRNNATEARTTLTAPTVSQWYKMEVVVNGATNVEYRLDGTLVATHTSNLPTAGDFMWGAGVRKAVGTATHSMDIDRFWGEIDWP